MKLSTRELILAWATCVIVLFAGMYLVCRPRISLWAEAIRKRRETIGKIEEQKKVLAQLPQWKKRLNSLQKSVRPLAPGRAAENFLKRTISELAAKVDLDPKREVKLTDRRTEKEKTHGSLHVLPITCPLQANTKGIVQLLYDLQTHSVMFDTRELVIRSDGHDKLTGHLTVNCVYTEEEGEK